MAVRRNNRITSVLGSIDRRVRSLEATGGASIPSSSVFAEPDADSTPRENLVEIPPDTFRKIIGARVYGPAATGNFGTRVELYFEEDIDFSADPEVDELGVIIEQDSDGNQTLQQIQVYGVNGYSNTSINLSSGKVFNPIEVAYGDWAEFGLRKDADQTDWRQTPPVAAISGKTVNSTIWYNPVIQDPDKTDVNGKDLVVTRAVDSATVDGANVTVTLNASSHLFQVGDVISVDIPAPFIGLDYYGNGEPDGLFEITAVTSNTISYVLDEPVSSPQTYEYDEETRHYVYAVARPYVPEETVWIDKRTEPNTVWVWKKYRWYNTADPIGDVAAEQDGIAPSPVTGLDVTSSLPSGSTSPVLGLTWTPPTTRSNGSSISGYLDGYDIWYKRSTESVWKKEFVKDGGQGISSHELKDAILLQNFTYNIRVYTVDIMGQYSTAATDSILAASYSETLNAPSTPTATSKLGTITVAWDGLDSTGELPVPGVLYIEFHESTTSGFTPSSSTLVESVPITNAGNYIVLTERLFDDTTFYYYKTKFVRQISPTELVTSDASTQSTGIKVTGVTGPDIVAGSVTTNKLEAGFVTASLLRGDIIRAGTEGANTRVELKTSGIFAYNSANDPVFSFDTSSATLTIGGYATNSNVSAVSNTANTALSTANTASTTANTAVTTANSKLDPANVIAEINSRFTSTGDSNTTTISGGAIRTDSLTGNRISATTSIVFSDGAYSAVIGNGVVSGAVASTVGMSLRSGASTEKGFISLYDDGNGVIIGRTGSNRIAFFDTTGAYMDLSSGTVNITGSSQVTLGSTLTRALNTFRVELGALNTTFDVFLDFSAATRAFRVTQTGFTFIGKPSNVSTDAAMFVYGRANALGIFADNQAAPSSRRMKTDIRDFEVPDSLFDITPKLFKYVNSIRYEHWPEKPNSEEYSEDTLGAIAEDFIDAGLDYLVTKGDDGKVEGLDYSRISVLLIPVIKDLKTRLDKLEKENK
jgi:hypothetical protein